MISYYAAVILMETRFHEQGVSEACVSELENIYINNVVNMFNFLKLTGNCTYHMV